MTQDDDRWTAYLYRRHRPEEIAAWARSLEFFRFVRAMGGHTVDGDELLISLELDDAVRRIGTGHVTIAGQPAFAYEQEQVGRLEISLHDTDDQFEVTESTVESARIIEADLRALLPTRVVDPPLDSERCICSKYYPHIWATRTS